MSWHTTVITGRYADSVRLMGVARGVRAREGVARCEVAMGTAANLEALRELGASVDATPADVVIAVDASPEVVEAAMAEAERALTAVPGGSGAAAGPAARPRSISSARTAAPDANLAIISVPGEYATLEAHQALTAGMHVFLFSDHVSLEDELALKQRGEKAGLLVMGPGCGTAMLGGIGLGFANVVAPGRVGIVAAAGTGAQEAACLIEAAGAGITQIIGVGGRDLSEAIGGIMYRQGMKMLAADDDTDILLLVSKPPAPSVVRTLAAAVPKDKRVVAAFVGWEGGDAPFEVHATIDEAVRAAVGGAEPDLTSQKAAVEAARGRTTGRPLVGLYSGGSLAHEAITILEPALGPIGGNAGHGDASAVHSILDLGEEEYTQGRPHPMVDLDLRLSMIADLVRDGHDGCVLLDVVLGHGAHANPGGELAAALAPLTKTGIVITSVCGTPGDPQDVAKQEAALRDAGVVVAPSNAAAARLAVAAVCV